MDLRKNRNPSRVCTPKTNIVQDDIVTNAQKSSTKKLRQARLPFKVIDLGSSPLSPKTITAPNAADRSRDAVKDSRSKDSRKRKLSYAKDEGNTVTKKDHSAAKKKKFAASKSDTVPEVISLSDEEHNVDVDAAEEIVKSSVDIDGESDFNTPFASDMDEKKGAGTPQTSSAQKGKIGSAMKLKIKLPFSGGKKKHRKSTPNHLPLTKSGTENFFEQVAQELSSDDIDDFADQLNPKKRKKRNSVNNENETTKTKPTTTQKEQIEVIHLVSEEEEGLETEEALKTEKSTKGVGGNIKLTNESSKTVEKIKISDSPNDYEKNMKPLQEIVISDNDNEADDETDNVAVKPVQIGSDSIENAKSKDSSTIALLNDGNPTSKSLTPKQVKLMEQRRKAREEKERILQEEKMKKQREKEEKEMAKKREREEKEELRRKEREEKDEQKRKEREEKERKRLADVEAKNEEKRKKSEAKEEELRKREEERKRKEQEKEEAELKKKKAAQAFTKFFVAKTPTNVQIKNEEDNSNGDGLKSLAFRPFQIKGDMTLAPIVRKNLTVEKREQLDDLVGFRNKAKVEKYKNEIDGEFAAETLYLTELRSGKILPGKWRRSSFESKDDVILLDDDLERVGQAIVEDTPSYIREEMRVKFYKFHDNRRPPYYGTWRKKSVVVKPRNPFAQDKKFFDYEVDSDDEWEEEEPGESLEDGSDEDREKESDDDDYEVDNEWFVPHGHLSDEELQNEDEFGIGNENTREAQKAKLQLLQQEFAQEMKRKTEKIKPRLIGCIWVDKNGNQPSECVKILWDTLEKKAMIFNVPPLVEESEVDRLSEANSPSVGSNGAVEKTTDKLKPITLSNGMVKDLIRLIHGNNHAKNFLINEYIAYIEKTEDSVKNGGLRKPLKSVVRDKIDEIAEWQAIDANASCIKEIEQTNVEKNDTKKKKLKRRLCWVVKQEILEKMDLLSLELKNSWEYTLPRKAVKVVMEIKKDEGAAKPTSSESVSTSADYVSKTRKSVKYEAAQCVKEKSRKVEDTSLSNTSSNNNSGIEIQSNILTASKEKKRVPLLMSVARGQQISTTVKNKLISNFLQQNKNDVNNLLQ